MGGGRAPDRAPVRDRDPGLRRVGRAHRDRSRCIGAQQAVAHATRRSRPAVQLAHRRRRRARCSSRRSSPTSSPTRWSGGGAACRATTIVLGFVGGLAPLSHPGARPPRDELAIAVAGPLVSFALGAVLAVAAACSDAVGAGARAPIAGGVVVVGVLNLILGVPQPAARRCRSTAAGSSGRSRGRGHGDRDRAGADHGARRPAARLDDHRRRGRARARRPRHRGPARSSRSAGCCTTGARTLRPAARARAAAARRPGARRDARRRAVRRART